MEPGIAKAGEMTGATQRLRYVRREGGEQRCQDYKMQTPVSRPGVVLTGALCGRGLTSVSFRKCRRLRRHDRTDELMIGTYRYQLQE